MAYTRKFMDEVRIKGKVAVRDTPFMRDSLPIVYTCENEGGIPYHSSGGRSLIVERGDRVYKINGVDPHGHLTSRVAASRENRLSDVAKWDTVLKYVGATAVDGKPFGVYTHKNTENAERTFDRLNLCYVRGGITPPCEYVCNSRVRDDAYQILFRMPSLESDLRVSEFMALMEDRLSQMPQEQLAGVLTPLRRIFGRLVGWMGYSMETLLQNSLVPTKSSWVPQNMVLHEVGNGYGAFRVDHTSTAGDNVDKYGAWLDKNLGDPDFPGNMFSFIVEAAEIGAKYPEVAKNLPGRGLSPFGRVMKYYRASEGKDPARPLVDVTPLFDAHQKTFQMGRMCADRNMPLSISIPEEHIRKIFED